jgi:flagella basal body P-ring formation protein FlgA
MNALPTVKRHLIRRPRARNLAAGLSGILTTLILSPTHATTLPEQLIGATQAFLEHAVGEHLAQSQIPGRPEIEINRLDPRLRLPLCAKPVVVTLESPAQPIGRVTTRVRCESSAPWTVFVPAQVRLYRQVLAVNRPVSRNAVLREQDLQLVERDVGLLNQGYLTEMAQAIGNKLTRAAQPGQVLSASYLVLAEVVRKGDQVLITARTGSIGVRMPGEALSDGAQGTQISVRNLQSKRVIKARVMGPGQVEVAM